MAKMFKLFAVMGLLVAACNAGEEFTDGQDDQGLVYDDSDPMVSYDGMPSAEEMFPTSISPKPMMRSVAAAPQSMQASQAEFSEDDLAGLSSEGDWADSYGTPAEDLAATEFATVSNVTEYSPPAQDLGVVEGLNEYESDAEFEAPTEGMGDWQEPEPGQEEVTY